MADGAQSESLSRNRFRKWVWPGVVLLAIGLFALRVYWQRNPVGLDGNMERGELVALASTPAGQEALARMLRGLAVKEPPLGDRLVNLIRRHSPERLLGEGEPSQADQRLLNALAVLDKLPVELKQPHLPLFIAMLDHPLHSAIAAEEIEGMGSRASNTVSLLFARLETNRYSGALSEITVLDLAAKLAPEDPRLLDILALWSTNTAVPPMFRHTAVNRLAELFPNDARTRAALLIVAKDRDPMISSAAQNGLSTLPPAPVAAPLKQ